MLFFEQQVYYNTLCLKQIEKKCWIERKSIWKIDAYK